MSYDNLNPELRMLLFSIESSCGVEVGGGDVFLDDNRKEISDIKHIFAFIAITYLEYTHRQVRIFMKFKYDSNITYALKRVEDLIAFRPSYRNRIYNISIDNGVIGLVKHIIHENKPYNVKIQLF